MKSTTAEFAALAFCAALLVCLPSRAGQKPNPEPILGAWSLEANAGSEYYYLNLEIKLVEGALTAALSELYGAFTAVPAKNVAWDGETLKFENLIPTPPDGYERPVVSEFKLVEGKLVGAMSIVEMGLTVPTTGTKK